MGVKIFKYLKIEVNCNRKKNTKLWKKNNISIRILFVNYGKKKKRVSVPRVKQREILNNLVFVEPNLSNKLCPDIKIEYSKSFYKISNTNRSRL